MRRRRHRVGLGSELPPYLWEQVPRSTLAHRRFPSKAPPRSRKSVYESKRDVAPTWHNRSPIPTYNVPAPTNPSSSQTIGCGPQTTTRRTTNVLLTPAIHVPTTVFTPSSTSSTVRTATRFGVQDVLARRLSHTFVLTASLRCPAVIFGAMATGSYDPNGPNATLRTPS